MSETNEACTTANGLPQWTIEDLQTHLQAAIDLEFWTIPFYMSAMFSIIDPSTRPFQLLRSVVNQEMLHLELACNIANAYGTKIQFQTPVYQGHHIPHLNFRLDDPNPTQFFHPFSAEIGALDEKRINAMCLIEYPEWDTERQPNLRPKVSEYGSIGEFYDALEVGMRELVDHLKADQNQKNFFGQFYNNFAQQTITYDGAQGLKQAINLINAITSQGEGMTEGDTDIPLSFQNTADGMIPSWPHFRKFSSIKDSVRDGKPFPATYTGVADPEPGSAGDKAQKILVSNFSIFLNRLEQLFTGGQVNDFDTLMFTIGSNIVSCWQNNAIPKFA